MARSALPLERGCVGRSEQGLSLRERQPVAHTHSELLRTLHPADARPL